MKLDNDFGLGTLSVGMVFFSVLVSAINIFLIRRADSLSASLLSLYAKPVK